MRGEMVYLCREGEHLYYTADEMREHFEEDIDHDEYPTFDAWLYEMLRYQLFVEACTTEGDGKVMGDVFTFLERTDHPDIPLELVYRGRFVWRDIDHTSYADDCDIWVDPTEKCYAIVDGSWREVGIDDYMDWEVISPELW